MTKAAEEFVHAFVGCQPHRQKVHTALFNLTDEIEMGHIESRAADLLVVVPATADLMAKMAYGNANDLASTALRHGQARADAAPP
jgi:phosphopantothenoylcysteine decarboxylase/phosphopantothenate--cysteine ligase